MLTSRLRHTAGKVHKPIITESVHTGGHTAGKVHKPIITYGIRDRAELICEFKTLNGKRETNYF